MSFQLNWLGYQLGLPTFDRVQQGRIWAFKRDNDTSNWGIYYSDDDGVNWILWTVPNPQPMGDRGPYIHKDNNGNIYYQSGVARWRTFHRVDSTTKEVTKVIDFYYPNGGMVDIYPWNFTEDNDGYIFVTQYYLSAAGGHMIFRSAPESKGKVFESLDILIRDFPDARHFHGTFANPFNGKLYIQIGDFQAKRFLVSDDKLETYKVIGGVTGHTGLTFTSEAVYTSEDLPKTNNYVWRTTDDINYEIVWTPPTDLIKTPIYYCHAVGNNELWLTFVDDNKATALNSAVVKLTKQDGLNSAWSFSLIDQYAGSDTHNSNWYAMASNGQGIIPEWSPYIYVEKCVWDSTQAIPTDRGIYKINRVSEEVTPLKLNSGKFVIKVNGVIRNGQLVQNVDGQIKPIEGYTL